MQPGSRGRVRVQINPLVPLGALPPPGTRWMFRHSTEPLLLLRPQGGEDIPPSVRQGKLFQGGREGLISDYYHIWTYVL